MELLVFIACAVVVLLSFYIYGVLINRGFGSYTRGVARAWGARYALPDDQGNGTPRLGRWPGRSGRVDVGVQERSRVVAYLLRGIILLAFLAAELYAGQFLFGSIWIGIIAWIATALISLAVA